MSPARNQLQMQINLIEQAMKDAGVWSFEVPAWVQTYTGGPVPDIWHWLQFIHLPMRMQGHLHKPGYLAPQLISYMNGNQAHQKILQLVIELDSLSPTLQKPLKS
jgi:hypothetical protein